ncbi:MAG: outer membrane protein OmpA-like peptidoglycan-associated protein, partial [Glaciecola sp.]
MRRLNQIAAAALAGALSLSACTTVSQDAIAAEGFAPSTINDPKIPIGPGSEIAVEAFEWGFRVEGNAIDGPVKIKFSNLGGATHNFRIDNAAGEVKLVEAAAGEAAEGELQLFGGGEYTYYCDVPGHRAQGMEGTIAVGLPGDQAPSEPVVGTSTDEATEPTVEPTTSEPAPTRAELDDSEDVAGALDSRGFARLYAVSFASGSAELADSAFPALSAMIDYLEVNADAALRVEGNTDQGGSAESNLTLSQDRADAVV